MLIGIIVIVLALLSVAGMRAVALKAPPKADYTPKVTPEELKTVARSALEENLPHLTFSDIRHEVKYTYTQTKAPVSRRERKEQKEKTRAGIRQMPVYDPDSDVNSLCMTINSWVSSIERVNSNTDFSTISNRAMLELMKQLTILESTINSIQKSLVERTSK